MNAEESFFDKKWLKAIAALVSLAALILFAGYHTYKVFTSEVQYVPAKERTYVDSITFAGYIAREETVIIDPAGGVIRSSYANASKHAKGNECVSVYPYSCADLIFEASALEKKLALLSDVMQYSSISSAEKKIYLSYVELMKKYAGGDCSTEDEAEELLAAMMMRDYVFDKETLEGLYNKALKDYDSAIKELDSIEDVKKGYMPYTGYMFKNGDRYGTLFTKELATAGSADDIFAAISRYNSELALSDAKYTVATATKSNVWYILAPLSVAEATRVERGGAYVIDADGVELRCVVEDIRVSEVDGTVAVLKIDELPPSFDYNRKMTVTLYFEPERTYSLPVSALRTSDNGENGVYIMAGGAVLFRRVEVVKSTDTYVLVKSYASYVESLNEEKAAEDIFGKESSDSSLVGIYRGNSYTEYEESIYDNSTVLIKDPYADVKINTRTDVEPSEFAYLGENELIIISGKNLYHGKLLS